MATILIVDDAPGMQTVLDLMLRRSNHEVILASDGNAALTQLAQESVDLIITDLMMPGMDGIELLQQLRANKRLETIPVIVLTAASQVHWKQKAEQHGANVFLTKPVSTDDLRQAIDQHLENPLDVLAPQTKEALSGPS